MKATPPPLFLEIEAVIKELSTERLTEERKALLQPLVDYIQKLMLNKDIIRLHFICTHNSRRSHLSQIWAQTLAYYFNFKNVVSYSGGTETTALFPMVIETLRDAGFEIQKLSEGKNPIYSIKYAKSEHPIIGFSKTVDDNFNPKSKFAAILTCNSAKEACPVVSGADLQIPITYEDPKAYDNTLLQKEKYQERSLQIASELYHVFSQIQVN